MTVNKLYKKIIEICIRKVNNNKVKKKYQIFKIYKKLKKYKETLIIKCKKSFKFNSKRI